MALLGFTLPPDSGEKLTLGKLREPLILSIIIVPTQRSSFTTANKKENVMIYEVVITPLPLAHLLPLYKYT